VARILIVDDDEIFCSTFSLFLSKIGHEFDIAQNLKDGLKMASRKDYDIVFLDVVLPDRSGLEGIGSFKEVRSSPEVIIITGKGEMNGPEIALRSGAWDYLTKPLSFSNVKLLIARALQNRKYKFLFLKNEILDNEFILGNDPKLKDCLNIASKAAGSEGSVLITGETGTGKELLARCLHANSSRSKSRFVIVDCTNLPENLVESLLFGHEKGAFTGADRSREGIIQQADGGTLFLDEVGDLRPSTQKSLLRVLQEKKYRPLGSTKEMSLDFRVISASNRNLKGMVEADQFRKDLYFRLVTFHIHLPPLRDRIGDIELLTNHYIQKICDELDIPLKGHSPDFLHPLMIWNWEGNIRELVNILRVAVAEGKDSPDLYPHFLPSHIRINYLRKCIMGKQDLEKKLSLPKFKEYCSLLQSKYLDELIQISGGEVEKALVFSGLSRSGFYNLLKKHGKKMKESLHPPRKTNHLAKSHISRQSVPKGKRNSFQG
jgi:two-component system, NtrC family, response regulator